MDDSMMTTCNVCGGNKIFAKSRRGAVVNCKVCSGKGKKPCPDCNQYTTGVCMTCGGLKEIPCESCNGVGKMHLPRLYEIPCWQCKGTGKIPKSKIKI